LTRQKKDLGLIAPQRLSNPEPQILKWLVARGFLPKVSPANMLNQKVIEAPGSKKAWLRFW
jgi:hypothetical protein